MTTALPRPDVVNPVSRPVVDAKLVNRATDRLGITEISGGNPADPANDLQAGALIAQGGKPVGKIRCFANVDHAIVIHSLQMGKRKCNLYITMCASNPSRRSPIRITTPPPVRGDRRKLNCRRPRKRTTQYSRDFDDEMDEARGTGSPAFAGDDGSGLGELFPVIARRASAEAIQPSPFAAP